MKKKFSSLLLLAASLLVVASCEKGGTSSSPSDSASESLSESLDGTSLSEGTSEVELVVPEAGETFSATWPSAAINSVLGGVEVVVPAFSSPSGFAYLTVEDDSGDYVYIHTLFDETGEDVYSAVLTGSGWAVDDTQYDDYGLVAIDSTESVAVQFYHYAGEIVFMVFLVPEEEEEPIIESATWPADAIVELLGSSVSVPAYTGEGPFFYAVLEDDFGEYLMVYAEADSTASEDGYVTLLETAGWTVDDSYYDDYGYFADDATESVEIQFYYWDGIIVFYIYAL
ncbi:MAG TPA: hypothetical protein PKC96_05935 [Bacilli bacterium]|nr:hypothetical protein [Bacilli bacterium]